MATGGILVWGPPEDDREAPDTLSAIYKYADKFHLNYSCFFGNDQFGYGEQFMGYEGTIEVLNRSELHFYPQKFGGKAPARVAARQEVHRLSHRQGIGDDNLSVQLHLRNWLESIRGNGQAHCAAHRGPDRRHPGSHGDPLVQAGQGHPLGCEDPEVQLHVRLRRSYIMSTVKSGRLILAAILAILVYGMIAAMLGTLLPRLQASRRSRAATSPSRRHWD